MRKKKKKAAPQSTVYLRCDVYKVLKASLHATRFVGKICKLILLNTKNPAWRFIFASLLDWGMQPRNYNV